MATTKIEWADAVWNPVTGCTKVSQGCKNCYAETIANRFWRERKFSDVICHEDRLDIPLGWKKPRRIFVNSMSDLFHEKVPDSFIDEVFGIMIAAIQHKFLILTKRPERMYQYMDRLSKLPFDDDYALYDLWRYTEADSSTDRPPFPINNVWLGASVEDQKTADERIPWLLKTPAAIRFVSYEPALGAVDFWKATGHIDIDKTKLVPSQFSWYNDTDLHWIIAGGESGKGARPAHPDWFRSVRDQCQEAGVPFFFKQMVVDGKMVKMPQLDGRRWEEYPNA